MRVREFLTEDIWCQGWTAKDAKGNDCHVNSDDARSFCLLGALIRCYPDSLERQKAQDRYASLIRILHKKRIKDFNDTAEWSEIEHIVNTVDA